MSNEAGYHVRTALGWLEVGAPDGAKESLSKALTLVDDEATKGLISDAMRLCSSANPRAADAAVKKIIAHERAQKVAGMLADVGGAE